jgi:hypothetical protein
MNCLHWLKSASLCSFIFCKVSFTVNILFQMLAELLCTCIMLLFTWYEQLFVIRNIYLCKNWCFFVSQWEKFSHKTSKSRSPVACQLLQLLTYCRRTAPLWLCWITTASSWLIKLQICSYDARRQLFSDNAKEQKTTVLGRCLRTTPFLLTNQPNS